MKKPELLAPAGNMESLKAAIEAGCDAVYLGGYMYGARSFAGNFSNEEIIEAIIYAHRYGVKIYVTVNTLIYEDEVETFMKYIDFLYRSDVDAVIIQDLGMLDLVMQTYPLLEVHASTQMHIHNLEGVQFLESLGVKRVVLARETDIDLIKEIKEKSKIELEIFIHGALCISYSGQCLMSSLIGGRSGNRGSCAGSCRQKYDLLTNGKKVNQNEYLLSTKDLNTLEHIGKLIDLGIESLKIEGRMKRPEYVYLTVKLYRKAIDEYCQKKMVTIGEAELLELKKIFHREFTKGFLFHEENQFLVNQKRPNHMGIPIGKVIDYQKGMIKVKLHSRLQNGDGIRILGKEDTGIIVTKMIKNKKQEKEVETGIVELPYKGNVQIGSLVLKTTDKKQLDLIHTTLSKLTRKVPITLELELGIGQKPILRLSDGKNQIEVIGEQEVKIAQKSVTSKKRIQEQILKFGNSIYQVDQYNLKIEDAIFISIKDINELRRSAIIKLDEKRCYHYPYKKEVYHRNVPNFPVEKRKSILIHDLYQYYVVEKENWNYIYVEKEELFNKLKNDSRVIYKTSRVLRHIPKHFDFVLVGEIGSCFSFPQVFTDWSLNVVNSYSVALLHAYYVKQVTLSYELDDKRIERLIDAYKNRYHAHPNLELIIYGKEEVMISKFHLLNYFHVKEGYLKDRFSNLYKIEENEDVMKIYNYHPRKLKRNYYHLGINSVRYQLVDENELEIGMIWNEFGIQKKTITRMDRKIK